MGPRPAPGTIRGDAITWLRSHRFELLLLLGIWSLAVAVIYLLAVGHQSPRRYQDEFLFWALAKSFAAGDGLVWRGVGLGLKSWLYPVLIAPSFWLSSSIAGAYKLTQLLNSMMIAGTIFPAFLMARLLLGRWRALLVALLAISVPAMNYAGTIGTESLGYLTCTAALGAMLLALARPRLRTTLLAYLAIAIAVLTRTQFVVLVPVMLGAIVVGSLAGGREWRRNYLDDRRSLFIFTAAALVAGGALLAIQGKSAVGLYSGVFDGLRLSWSTLWFWLKAFTADVYVMTAILPVVATVAMLGSSDNRRDPLVGAFLALTVAATAAFIFQVSWFSAVNPYEWRSRHIFYERYMFYLGPLFFTGLLVAWRRVSVAAAVVSVAVAMLVLSGFQSDSVLVPFSYDAFSLSLIGRYLQAHPQAVGGIGISLAGIGLIVGVLYIGSTLPKLAVARLCNAICIATTLVVLVATQAQNWHYARTNSVVAFEGLERPVNFIDRSTDEEVGVIVTATDSPAAYFSTEFWNDRVTRFFATDEAPFDSPVMYSPKCLFDWDQSGKILATGCDVVPDAWFMRSNSVTVHFKDELRRLHPSPALPQTTLIVDRGPSRLLAIVSDRDVRNGVVQGLFKVTTFLERPGQLRVKLAASKRPRVVQIGDAASVRVPAGRAGSVVADVKANELDLRVSIKTNDGLPDNVTVEDVEVRQPGRPWTSIR